MRRRAMTLVELLVTLGVIAVLIAIAVPVLRAVYAMRHDAINLSNARATMQDFAAYAAAHDGELPNPGLPQNSRPGDPYYFSTGGTPAAISVYGALEKQWPVVLKHWLGHSERHWHSSFDDFTFGGNIDPSDVPEGYDVYGQQSQLLYSPTCYTIAEVWTMPATVLDEDAYREVPKVVRLDDIAHPGRKGVLVNRDRPGEPRQIYVAFADGAAAMHAIDDARPQAAPPRSADPNLPGFPVMATLHGYEGIDF